MVNNTEKNEQAANSGNKHYSAANSAGSTDTSPGG